MFCLPVFAAALIKKLVKISLLPKVGNMPGVNGYAGDVSILSPYDNCTTQFPKNRLFQDTVQAGSAMAAGSGWRWLLPRSQRSKHSLEKLHS